MLGESRLSPRRAIPTSTIGAVAGRPDLQPIVTRLDESIRATLPGLDYAVKWKRAYYGLPKLGWIIEIAACDVSVNVLFLGGGDFESPPPLGNDRPTRYIKVTSLEGCQRPELAEVDRSSWTHAGSDVTTSESVYFADDPASNNIPAFSRKRCSRIRLAALKGREDFHP